MSDAQQSQSGAVHAKTQGSMMGEGSEIARLRAEVERLTAERDAIERRTIERCEDKINGLEVPESMATIKECKAWLHAKEMCAAAIRALLEEAGE